MEESERAYLNVMKVATAISIIRNTPSGKTAKEYAQQLCNQYEQSQLNWKSKYKTAEEDILKLRQQVLLLKTQKRKDDSSDTEMFSNSESLFPTPPSSLTDRKKENKTNFFHQNTVFLQSIISIKQTLAESQDMEKIQETTKHTISHNLDLISEIVTDDNLQISCSNLQQGIQCIVDISNILYDKDYRDIHIKAGAIIESLINKILSIDGLDKVSMETKEKFRILVMCFTGTEHLNYMAATINILMTQCEQFCDKIRECQRDRTALNCVYYENMFYIIQCILNCVRNKSVLLQTPEGKRFCENLQTRIDDCLLHITERFPLISHMMWNISGQLQTYIQESV